MFCSWISFLQGCQLSLYWFIINWCPNILSDWFNYSISVSVSLCLYLPLSPFQGYTKAFPIDRNYFHLGILFLIFLIYQICTCIILVFSLFHWLSSLHPFTSNLFIILYFMCVSYVQQGLISFCNSFLSSTSQVNSGCLDLPKLLALFHQCSLLGSTYIILYTTVWTLFKTVSRGNPRAHLIFILFLGDHYALLTNT